MNKKDTRFWDKVSKQANVCWIWNGAVDAHGYGSILEKGKIKKSHRVSYIMFHGEIPKDVVIDHICKIKRCVNPLHLQVVTLGENTLLGDGPTAQNKRKTHCIRGHKLSGDNIYLYERAGHTNRQCRICRKLTLKK